ncbi:putative n-acetylglucosamine-6-phosphate deacetylase [Drepanopeziza brunnea f. sp. 'multigermtubi' MB_m1]|uniref:N-acetylglucosamine-6-phosphate deacetylase n=2 Tax=Drepanopeziza brunnea f. sp. 'multigermtubi' TaxID=698441 RepID=K1X8J3_MARBU|nr:putative n-acetylglucosamine-6-phosphate deacetylase [Drepanopeziza brunnea f. sp. 'multigermtubi' MB_m1]EKD17013.1 putative n-acetylglucosamine-6-phosphate deacetylase [Drepanopeziza brunnea f. sp. 'multigermtubi' MB_m1]
MSSATQFINCRKCTTGILVPAPLTIDSSSGLIIPNTPLPPNTQRVDLKNAIISPGFLELQTNGALGFHFTHYSEPEYYQAGVRNIARYLPSTGVTGFYPTIPTVPPAIFQRALPFLRPHDQSDSASVLGAHVEGPFLSPLKKGAHDAKAMHVPKTSSLESIYGKENLENSIRVLTLAPELPGALSHINTLTEKYGVRVSMGHSAANHEQGLEGLKAGANLITHMFNAMNPLHHREPGLPGLISGPYPPYFSIIADSIHLHPRIVGIAYRSSPSHCILITDGIELSGLPDGIHPGHAQIPFNQLKAGNRVTIEGTDTLIGTCVGLDECVRNLMAGAEIPVEQAVRCVTENVADAMGLKDRGALEVGRRGDFVVLDESGEVEETWIMGKRVFCKI